MMSFLSYSNSGRKHHLIMNQCNFKAYIGRNDTQATSSSHISGLWKGIWDTYFISNELSDWGWSDCLISQLHALMPGINNVSYFPGGSVSKESTCHEGHLGSIPGLGNPLEEGMATHSGVLAWRIPWKEEPGELQSMESKRVDTAELLSTALGRVTVFNLLMQSSVQLRKKLHFFPPNISYLLPFLFYSLAL